MQKVGGGVGGYAELIKPLHVIDHITWHGQCFSWKSRMTFS